MVKSIHLGLAKRQENPRQKEQHTGGEISAHLWQVPGSQIQQQIPCELKPSHFAEHSHGNFAQYPTEFMPLFR